MNIKEYRKEYNRKKLEKLKSDPILYQEHLNKSRERYKKDKASGKRKKQITTKEKENARKNKHNKKIREEVLRYYSGNVPECKCCGIDNIKILTIDHINGGGCKERKKLGLYGVNFYAYLRRQGYPKGYRVLCHNCNMSLGIYKYCPHDKYKELQDYCI